MARQISVTEYDPQWEGMFKSEAKDIRGILGKNCVGVYHIGSTAVKGLKAKPTVDIMAVVKDISLVDPLNAEFEKNGYECRGEGGVDGRRYFVKGGEEHTYHVHIYEKSNKNQIDRHIALRDYLRSHQRDAEEYGELKVKLAERFVFDSEGYCKGKEDFVKDLEKKALAWKKQQEDMSLYMAIGMCLGVGIGSAVGIAMGNVGIGMCYGTSIGLFLGIAIGGAKKR